MEFIKFVSFPLTCILVSKLIYLLYTIPILLNIFFKRFYPFLSYAHILGFNGITKESQISISIHSDQILFKEADLLKAPTEMVIQPGNFFSTTQQSSSSSLDSIDQLIKSIYSPNQANEGDVETKTNFVQTATPAKKSKKSKNTASHSKVVDLDSIDA